MVALEKTKQNKKPKNQTNPSIHDATFSLPRLHSVTSGQGDFHKHVINNYVCSNICKGKLLSFITAQNMSHSSLPTDLCKPPFSPMGPAMNRLCRHCLVS